MATREHFYRWRDRAVEDSDLVCELAALSPETDGAEIEDRFYRELAFGTGGCAASSARAATG